MFVLVPLCRFSSLSSTISLVLVTTPPADQHIGRSTAAKLRFIGPLFSCAHWHLVLPVLVIWPLFQLCPQTQAHWPVYRSAVVHWPIVQLCSLALRNYSWLIGLLLIDSSFVLSCSLADIDNITRLIGPLFIDSFSSL